MLFVLFGHIPLQVHFLTSQQEAILSLIHVHEEQLHADVQQTPLIEHSVANIEYWTDWLISGIRKLQTREEHSALLLQFCDVGVQLGKFIKLHQDIVQIQQDEVTHHHRFVCTAQVPACVCQNTHNKRIKNKMIYIYNNFFEIIQEFYHIKDKKV